MSAYDIDAKKAAFEHPMFVPDAFKAWLEDMALRWSTDLFSSQIQGLRGARWKTAAPVVDPEVCNDTSSWSDITTVGPIITGLSDGIWLFIYGYEAPQTGIHSVVLKINDRFADGPGGGAKDLNEVRSDNGGSAMGWAIYAIDGKTPPSGVAAAPHGGTNNNTVKMVYNVSTAGKTFGRRYLHALRIDRD